MPTPEPYPYRKLNYPVNNLQQDFTEAQKAQTRANIGIPASVGETGKVLGVSDASTGELGWVDQPTVPTVDQSYDATSANPQSGTAVAEAVSTKQDTISDLSDIRSGAALGTTSVQPADLAPYATTSDMNTALAGKQDVISDLSDIRSGAALGATSVQDVTVDGVSVVSNGVAAITTPTFTQQQANWAETNQSSVSYIQNKPSNLVQDANYVHTDNNFTNADASKLSGIEANAEVNVQSDWSESNSSSDAFIKNKPQNLVQDASYVHTDENFTSADKTKLSGIEAGAEVNVQADWSESDSSSDAYIRNKPDLSIYAQSANLATVATTGDFDDLVNKPTIPAAQVNSDWNSNSGVSQILNRPNLAAVATTGDYGDLVNKPSIPAAQVQSNWSESDSSAVSYIQNKPSNLVQDASYVHTDENFTSAEKTKLAGIAAGAEVNVQANWSESDTSSDSYIQNKPQNLVQDASYVHTDENFTSAEKTKLAGIAAGAEVNVQADWNESDSSSDSYIQNKPAISNVPAVTSSDDAKVLKASYSGGVGSYSWENETGTTYSAGTGIDITNNTISVENPLPSSTSADEGKVLKVDANGDPEWSTGGGSQVQSDWAETDTTDPSYIENKPTPKTLVAGQGIAISESSASLTVTNTVARDAVNLIAGSGVTLTQSGSDLTISSVVPTVDQTYDASSVNAQSGVAVADAIGNLGTNLTSAQIQSLKEALGVDETVLFNSSTMVSSFTTSEPIENFEYLKVIVEVAAGVKAIANVVMTTGFSSYLSLCYLGPHNYGNSKDFYMWRMNYSRSGNTFTLTSGSFCGWPGSGSPSAGDAGITSRGLVYSVIGIHRVASN